MEQTVAAYASEVADYGRSRDPEPGQGGLIRAVRPESPADDAGIEPGMRIVSVNGVPLTDMIVWLWESGEAEIDIEAFDPRDATVTPCTLERFPEEDWGIDFDGPVFDGMRTCVNACIFCFMTMLPKNMRNTLYIRDDDYRLSFLQGNFVTLTNMSEEDVEQTIRYHMSPMNVSLHAVSPDVRRRLMGKNAARGLEVLERLMAADIEIHAQIVLCPGLNDGEELARTLAFAEAHPQITSMGIVPLGFTKFQKRFTSSFSDDVEASRAVIAQVEPYQRRARERFGRSVFQLSDEFYLDAELDPPPAEFYDGYPQYYDGIGMIRSYMDDTAELLGDEQRLAKIRAALSERGLSLVALSGEGARRVVEAFVGPGLGGRVVAIENRYFGGNVNVTGLICGCDLLEQVDRDLAGVMLFMPSIMFNSDGLTLDGYHRDQLVEKLTHRGARTMCGSTMPYELTEELERALGIAD